MEDSRYFIMHYLGGGSLHDLLDNAPDKQLDPVRACRIMCDVSDAVAYLHRSSEKRPALVHQDLKPQNILFDDAGKPHVADFGISALVSDLHERQAPVGGTLDYASPEQVRAFREKRRFTVDTRSDIWSLGVILYEMVTGKRPFHGTENDIKEWIEQYEPPSATDFNVPAPVAEIMQECLAKNPIDRPTAKNLHDHLRCWLDSVSAIPAQIDFQAELHRLCSDFSERPLLFDEVYAWPEHLNERLLLLVGEFGSGKSAFIAYLISQNLQQRILAWHICQHDVPEWRSPAQFIRSLAGMLATRLPAYREALEQIEVREALRIENCKQDPESAFQTAIVAPLSNADPPSKCIFFILVDALDEADQPSSGSIPALLVRWHRRLPEWLRIVATTRRGSIAQSKFQGVRQISIDSDDAKLAEDLRQSIEQFVRNRLNKPNLAERLQQSRVSVEAAIMLLLNKCELNYLYVTEVLAGIEHDLLEFQDLKHLPPGLDALFSEFFRRQWPDKRSFAEVRPILELLVAAQEPLTEELLADATGFDEYEVADRLSELGQYIDRRQNTACLRKRALREWLAESKGTYHIITRRGHEKLAKVCLKKYLDSGPISEYAIRHLPNHLSACRDWDSLNELLTNWDFLEAKARGGMIVELYQDFLEAALALKQAGHQRAERFELLGRALGMDLSFLGRHSEALFQCLWNRCWWLDAPERAEHLENATAMPKGKEEFRLHKLMERWRRERTAKEPWLRSLRPPPVALTSPPRMQLRGEIGGITAVAVSPDGKWIATGGQSGGIEIWDRASGSCRLQVTDTPESSVRCLRFAADGNKLASIHDGNAAILWDANTGSEFARLDGDVILPSRDWILHGSCKQFIMVDFVPMTSRLVIGGSETPFLSRSADARRGVGLIVVWDTLQESAVRIKHLNESVLSMAIGRDGTTMTTASHASVYRWKMGDWDNPTRVKCIDDPDFRFVVLSESGNRLAVCCGLFGGIRVCDTGTGNPIVEFPNCYEDSVAFVNGEQQLVVFGSGPNMEILDIQQGKSLVELSGHADAITCVAEIPGASELVSGSKDGTVIVHDVSTEFNNATRLRADESSSINGFRHILGGEYFATTGSSTIRLCDVTRGKVVAELRNDSDEYPPGHRFWEASGLRAERTLVVAEVHSSWTVDSCWEDSNHICLWDLAPGSIREVTLARCNLFGVG